MNFSSRVMSNGKGRWFEVCCTYQAYTSRSSCAVLILAPAQTAVGFWLGKGCRVQVEYIYLYIWQGPGGSLAVHVFL